MCSHARTTILLSIVGITAEVSVVCHYGPSSGLMQSSNAAWQNGKDLGPVLDSRTLTLMIPPRIQLKPPVWVYTQTNMCQDMLNMGLLVTRNSDRQLFIVGLDTQNMELYSVICIVHKMSDPKMGDGKCFHA